MFLANSSAVDEEYLLTLEDRLMDARAHLQRVGSETYIEELQGEMRRVTWPSWKQVRATTGVVIGAVIAFAAYFFVVDQVLGRAITRVFTVFSR